MGNLQGTSWEPPGTQHGTSREPTGNQHATFRQAAGSHQGPSGEPAEDQQGTNTEPTGDQQGTIRDPAGNQQGTDRVSTGNLQGASREPSGTQQRATAEPAGKKQGTSREPAGDHQGPSREPAGNHQGTNIKPAGYQRGTIRDPAGNQQWPKRCDVVSKHLFLDTNADQSELGDVCELEEPAQINSGASSTTAHNTTGVVPISGKRLTKKTHPQDTHYSQLVVLGTMQERRRRIDQIKRARKAPKSLNKEAETTAIETVTTNTGIANQVLDKHGIATIYYMIV